MHLLVLSAFRLDYIKNDTQFAIGSQCTFWCSVLSDPDCCRGGRRVSVSMHLLVLSAFRRSKR